MCVRAFVCLCAFNETLRFYDMNESFRPISYISKYVPDLPSPHACKNTVTGKSSLDSHIGYYLGFLKCCGSLLH